jgi:superfamily II DNA or RNA helicase/HKD family nuclease
MQRFLNFIVANIIISMPFITNYGQRSLRERLEQIMPKVREMKFLVGFFYFSGLDVIFKALERLDREGNLKENSIKVLVGLGVDQGLYGLYEYAQEHSSRKDMEEDFCESLARAFVAEELDRPEVWEQVKFFLRLLEENKLVIRKTRKPNHSKLYIFKREDDVLPALFITGSSNLTRAGLEEQHEFNVELKDWGIEEAEAFFDELWRNAVSLNPDVIVRTFRERTFFRSMTPFQAWAYLVNLYLNSYSGKEDGTVAELIKASGFIPYSYQLEAVSQAVKTCQMHGGVILADVVGLGKTVVACAVARKLGGRGVVICPPHLVGDINGNYGWTKYLRNFSLRDEFEVFSTGNLDGALEYVRKHEDEVQVVIVDEAHRFRNERTSSHQNLQAICRGRKVLLLTATPFNNRPSDIYALLKLFTPPGNSSILLEKDLKGKFEAYQKSFENCSYILRYYSSVQEDKRVRAKRLYEQEFGGDDVNPERVKDRLRRIAKEIRGILEPVVIRRNRLDLKHYEEKIDMPRVMDPIEWFYELTNSQMEFYDKVINTFQSFEEGGSFTGALYYPAHYLKEKPEEFERLYQRNLYDFMRRLLVKRFESSFRAFRDSLDNFRETHEKILEFVKDRHVFVLDRSLLKKLLKGEEELEGLAEDYGDYRKIYRIGELNQDFLKDIQRDKELFESLMEEFDMLELGDDDPKLKRLVLGLEELLKDRKVVIFTEYLDTARYLGDALEKFFPGMVLKGYENLEGKIRTIYRNFDASAESWDDQYKILVATDRLSEGFNLNRAGAVINYDIPWNPVRVIQRVGRINRIGKKVYEEIYIINFFPTERGADIVKSREIAQQKLFMIHRVLGEDSKLLSPEEEPQPSRLYRRINASYEDVERLTEGESLITRLREEWRRIEKACPNIRKEIEKMPQRIKVAKAGEENSLIVFIKRGEDIFVSYVNYENPEPASVGFEEVLELVREDNPQKKSLPLSSSFWEHYSRAMRKRRTGGCRGRLEEQARNLLKSLIGREEFVEHHDFLRDLIEDISTYCTLSEYTLSLIKSWNGLKTEDLKRRIEELKALLGKDFLKKIKERKEPTEEVIIAIENIQHAGD